MNIYDKFRRNERSGWLVNTKETHLFIRKILAATLAWVILAASASAEIKLFAPTARLPGQSWELKAASSNAVSWTVRFNNATYSIAGAKLALPLTMPSRNMDGSASALTNQQTFPLEVEATLANGKTETVTRGISYGTARDALIADWIASIQIDDGAKRKSNSLTAPGQCKRYLINAFAEVSAAYELEAAQGITLYMPERPNDEKSGRIQGAAWILPLLGTGNPFAEAAAYDFDDGGAARANKLAARTLLESLQPGDVIQMMALFNNGARGTHTMLVTAAYDPVKDLICWSDSNLRNQVVDGVRYGTVMAYQSRTVEELIGWLANPGCAATVYRLVEGIRLREPRGDTMYVGGDTVVGVNPN